jgi:hypothetical protein
MPHLLTPTDGGPFLWLNDVSYILEELDPPRGVIFAWLFDDEKSATKMLLKQMRRHGHKKAYKLYVSFELAPNSREKHAS